MLALASTPEDGKGFLDLLAEWWTEGTFLLDGLVLIGVLVAYFLFKIVVLGAMDRLARHTDNDLDDRLVHFARTFCGWVFAEEALEGDNAAGLGAIEVYVVAAHVGEDLAAVSGPGDHAPHPEN